MRSIARLVALSALAVASAPACGKSQSGDRDCAVGSERCDCDEYDACDGDLECRSGLCVEPGAGGASGSGAAPAGGIGTGGAQTGGGAIGGSAGRGEGGEDATGGSSGNGGEPAGGSGGMGLGGTPIVGGGSGGMLGRGGAGSGGIPGGGGSSSDCPVRRATAADTLIDDLEDGENTIALPRIGYWYTYSDGSCTTVTPPPDPSGATPFPPTAQAGQNASFGARINGTGCTTWGAGMGFDLNNCGSRSVAYDANVFQGISFWYKSTTPLRLIVATQLVIPTTRGGLCVPGAGMGMECDNGHGVDLPAAPTGRATAIPFAMFNQTFGQMKSFDKTQIVYVQFQVSQATQPFDFTIDDVAFTP